MQQHVPFLINHADQSLHYRKHVLFKLAVFIYYYYFTIDHHTHNQAVCNLYLIDLRLDTVKGLDMFTNRISNLLTLFTDMYGITW